MNIKQIVGLKKLPKILLLLLMSCFIFLTPLAKADPTPHSTSTPHIIKFATEATYPPIVSMSATGEIGGFETELMKNICQKANLQCEFHHRPFDSLFPSLSFKKIDVVYGGIGITEARKGQVLFSKVLYNMPVGFIYKESFTDKTIGFQQGATGFEQYLKKHYPQAKLKTYASIQDALLDLQNQRIQAVFGDLPVLKYWLKNANSQSTSNATAFKFLALEPKEILDLSEGNGIAVSIEEKALIQKINKAFDEAVADGTFEKLKKLYLD
jgi:arginine transport system substrate-binding protein